MTKPEYQIHVREDIYLDNMLDLFSKMEKRSEDDYELFFFTPEGSTNIQGIIGVYWATNDQLIIHDISLNPSYRGENMGFQMLDELQEKYPDVSIRATGNGVWIRMLWIRSLRKRFIRWQNYTEDCKVCRVA